MKSGKAAPTGEEAEDDEETDQMTREKKQGARPGEGYKTILYSIVKLGPAHDSEDSEPEENQLQGSGSFSLLSLFLSFIHSYMNIHNLIIYLCIYFLTIACVNISRIVRNLRNT